LVKKQPYSNLKVGRFSYRRFSKFCNTNELVWHRDLKDRYVKVLNRSDWKFQYDNELPIDLTKEKIIFIPKMHYHRIIKGTTDLEIAIKE